MRGAAARIGLGAALLLSLPAAATTWGEKTIGDPIDGRGCRVAIPASMGSYIYQWPEKYDQVFFPVTDSQGIWSCASGFASLIGDVELTAEEKQRIESHLAALSEAERQRSDIAGKLARAEAVYALRDLDPERRGLIHRALAYGFEALAEDPVKADSHRQAALKIMLERLAEAELPEGKRMEYLFVSANYLRERGEPERSDRLLALLQAEIDKHRDGELAAYGEYLSGLLPSARAIQPGGKLAP